VLTDDHKVVILVVVPETLNSEWKRAPCVVRHCGFFALFAVSLDLDHSSHNAIFAGSWAVDPALAQE
jgi:hypothetical protein